MPANFAVAVVLLVILAVFWVRERNSVDGQARRLMTDTKDPQASRQKVRQLFAAQAAKEKAQRAALWHEAQTSIRAAHELGRRIREDVKGQELVRAQLSEGDAEVRRALDQERAEAEEQLARLEVLIHQLQR